MNYKDKGLFRQPDREKVIYLQQGKKEIGLILHHSNI